MQRRALDRQTRVTSFFDPLSHFGDVLFDRRGDLGVVRFRNRADAVWEVRHRAFDTIMVEEQVVDVAALVHGRGAPFIPIIPGPYPSCRGPSAPHAGAHLAVHARSHLAVHTHSHTAHSARAMTG